MYYGWTFKWIFFILSFNAQDISNVQFVLKFCANMISNTLAYHRELTLKKQNEALLNIAKNLFTRLSKYTFI